MCGHISAIQAFRTRVARTFRQPNRSCPWFRPRFDRTSPRIAPFPRISADRLFGSLRFHESRPAKPWLRGFCADGWTRSGEHGICAPMDGHQGDPSEILRPRPDRPRSSCPQWLGGNGTGGRAGRSSAVLPVLSCRPMPGPRPITEFRLTDHALFEMGRRQITETEIATVLRAPEQVELARPGRAVYQSRLEYGEARDLYLLRVFVDLGRQPAAVVSAYRTSKIRKYWR